MISALVTRLIGVAATVVEYVATKRQKKPTLDPRIEKLNSEAVFEQLEAKRAASKLLADARADMERKRAENEGKS